MSSNFSPTARKQCDFTKLLTAGYKLELHQGSTQDFHVTFHGPKETVYETGVWKVHVILPEDYPFASPSIGFVNKILHPNIDESSGSVCLDVINQTWTPLYSLVNIFEIFLPQLLTYPNPSDPLNSDAASLFLRDKTEYNEKVKEYVRLYANRETWDAQKRSSNSTIKTSSSSSSSTGPSSSAAVTSGNDTTVLSPPSPFTLQSTVQGFGSPHSRQSTSDDFSIDRWDVEDNADQSSGQVEFDMVVEEEEEGGDLDDDDDLLDDDDDD